MSGWRARFAPGPESAVRYREPCKSPRGQGAVLAMFRSREINDHTKQALLTEITLTEALLNGRQARK